MVANSLALGALVGYTNWAKNGQWTWNDGSPTTYVNWFPRKSDSKPNLPCMALFPYSWGWFDVECSRSQDFVCQRPKIGKTEAVRLTSNGSLYFSPT